MLDAVNQSVISLILYFYSIHDSGVDSDHEKTQVILHHVCQFV